jgi:hypothetical protein
MSTEPLRPTVLETVLYEPDEGAVIAVLPGCLWLTPGDIVELDDPSKDARVLSSRLQLRSDAARVLIVLDIPEAADDTLRGDTPTEVVLGADLDSELHTSQELDDELEKLTEEARLEPAPDET